MNKRGLGRGLGALIPGAEEDTGQIEVVLDRIVPNPHQPRRHFDQHSLEELAQSIVHHGLLQPIVLRPWAGDYQLVAGERRFRAAKLAGLDTIPAIIMELNDSQVAEIALVENLQREDLNPIEEAEAYKRLLGEFNLTQEVLAARIGKSRPAIANRLRLLNLAPPVRELVAQGQLTPGHARTLLSLPEEEQVQAAETILSKGLTVRAAEKTRRTRKEKAPQGDDPNNAAVQQQLMEHLGTRVMLEEKDGKGRIIIEFYSSEDATRIVQNILS